MLAVSIRKALFMFGQLLLLLTVFSNISLAQPAQTRIIDNVWIERLNTEFLVHINFVHPVQYITHFPQDSGNELRIQLRTFVLGEADKGAETDRESIRPESNENIDLTEIAYEGDFSDTPFLILTFKNNHRFEVRIEEDSRSVSVLVKPDIPPEANP